MSARPISIDEIEGIDHLIKVTSDFLDHPDVVNTVAGVSIINSKLRGVWSLVWTYLQQHPTRRVPSRALAGKLSFAAQAAADVLDHPEIRKIPFAVRSANVASALRVLVKRMKAFRV